MNYFPWITDRLDQPAGTLSGGEQQQLAMRPRPDGAPRPADDRRALARSRAGRDRAPHGDRAATARGRGPHDPHRRAAGELRARATPTAPTSSRRARSATRARRPAWRSAATCSARSSSPVRRPGSEPSRDVRSRDRRDSQPGRNRHRARASSIGLLALGIVLIYKGSRILNLAHPYGGLVVAFLCWWMTSKASFPPFSWLPFGLDTKPRFLLSRGDSARARRAQRLRHRTRRHPPAQRPTEIGGAGRDDRARAGKRRPGAAALLAQRGAGDRVAPLPDALHRRRAARRLGVHRLGSARARDRSRTLPRGLRRSSATRASA